MKKVWLLALCGSMVFAQRQVVAENSDNEIVIPASVTPEGSEWCV